MTRHQPTEAALDARGVTHTYDPALPLDQIHEPSARDQQYRIEIYDPATVNRYAVDLERGDTFPPLIGRRRNKTGGYVLLSGMHRWHAARRLGWDTFPAYIVTCTPKQGRLISFDANRTHGKALSPSELGELAARLVELDGMSNADAAATVGATIQQVGAALAAHRCDRRAAKVADVDTTRLTMSLRATLNTITDDKVFGDTAELVVTHNLGGGTAQALVGQLQKLDQGEALERIREKAAVRAGFAGGRGHRKPERERLQNALWGLLDIDPDLVAGELAEMTAEQADWMRDRICKAAGHLLTIGKATA